MTTIYYDIRFDYDIECQRKDAPKKGMGEWLNAEAIRRANRRLEKDWEVDKARLKTHDDGTTSYQVTLKATTT